MVEDADDTEARLEAPSLFRKRRKKAAPEQPAVHDTAETPAEEPTEPELPEPTEPEPTEPVTAPTESAGDEPPTPERPAARSTSFLRRGKSKSPEPAPVVEPPVEPEAVEPEAVEPEVVEPAAPVRSTPRSASFFGRGKPTVATEPSAAESEPTPVAASAAVATQEPQSAYLLDETQPHPEVAAPVAQGELEAAPPRAPWLTGWLAVVVTSLVVGVVVVLLTAAGGQLCRLVKGTSSCGGAGLFLLIAILIVAVIVGSVLLRSARVPEPASTSVLAVGLLSVLVLLFLVGSIFAWWMIIAIPLLSIAAFALSHWVTTAVVATDD